MRRHRFTVLLAVLVPLVAAADTQDASMVDRIITIVSSIIVPILLALLGHKLGEGRTKKEEERVRGKSLVLPPPRPKTVVGWIAEVGNVATPVSQLITPSATRKTWMPIAVIAALIGIGVITGVLVSRLVGGSDKSAPQVATGGNVAATPTAPTGTTYGVFIDRSDAFVRAGTADGLARGASVKILDGKGAVVSSGVVVEAWEHTARMNVTPALPAGGSLRASFTAAPAAPVAVAAPPVARPRPPPTTASSAPPVAPAGLKGDASMGGFGPARRIWIQNNGNATWTNCDLRLPNNKRYRMTAPLGAGQGDGIMLMKFVQDGVEHDVDLTWLDVKCAEGSTRLTLHP